jgi:hypothetical protein
MELNRSGNPQHINGTSEGGVVGEWPVTYGPTVQLQIWNTSGAEELEVFLNDEAKAAGAGNGILIAGGHSTGLLWVEVKRIWTLSENDCTFRCLAICRP